MSHGIGAEAASIVTTRDTIEPTAKSKGIEDGSLFVKIEAMCTERHSPRNADTCARDPSTRQRDGTRRCRRTANGGRRS